MKYIILVLVLFCKLVYSQDNKSGIKGFISDEDNKPLQKVVVKLDDKIVAITDSLGEFNFSVLTPGKHVLTTSCLGKRELNLEVNLIPEKIYKLHLTLIDDPINLQESSVSARFKLNFKDIADLPYSISFSYYVTNDSCIYLVNGLVGEGAGISTKILAYDPNINKWSVLTNNLIPKFSCTAAYIRKTNKIYVIGGVDPFGNLNQSIESVDVKTGEVKKLKVKNPIPCSYGGCAVYEDKIYLFGGSKYNAQNQPNSGIGLNSLIVFDPLKEEFKELAPMPIGVETSGTILNGYLYTFGGYNPFLHNLYTNIQKYDIKNDSWQTIGHMPKALSATKVSLFKNMIFLVDSYDKSSYVAIYDPQNNLFKELDSNIKSRKHSSAGIYQNRYLTVFGSSIRSENVSKSSQVVDLSKYYK